MKKYGSRQTKSWLPYEWFDCVDKLDYEGLPPHRCWISKVKNESEECLRVFQERGMKTFADWLEYCNNLDVGLFLEALEKMRRFYSGLGVNI